jgi:maleylpyruvate isomerase
VSTPPDVARLLEGARVADDRLAVAVERITDADARAPSALPGWTRGHVLTHLARHAEANTKLVTGESSVQYPGGREEREAAIDAGAGRPATEIVADLAHWAAALHAAYASCSDWARPVEFMAVGRAPLARSPRTRWREVEVHHVDLDLGYTPDRWPAAFVREYLPEALESLDGRLPPEVHVHVLADDLGDEIELGPRDTSVRDIRGPGAAVLAWCLGRTIPPGTLRAREANAPAALPTLAPWA